MNFAAAMTALETHARDAGAALTAKILDVDRASPTPKGRCIRLWWAGDGPPARMGAERTLNSELVGERVAIVAFFPVGALNEDAAGYNDAEARQLVLELRTRILGDSQLGGAVTDLAIASVETGWELAGNTRYRTVDITVVLDYTEIPIAP